MSIINRLLIGCIWFLACANSHAFVIRSGGQIEVNTTTRLDNFLNPLLSIFINNIAFSLAMLAIIIVGGGLVWGVELNEFARKFFTLIFTLGLAIFAPNLLFVLFDFVSISSVNIHV